LKERPIQRFLLIIVMFRLIRHKVKNRYWIINQIKIITIKENIENAPSTTSELRKPIEWNTDKKEDAVPRWDDFEVIDSYRADDESSSRHNDISEDEIESDNDVSTSEIIRNNCQSVNRDEEFPLKSDDLSTEKNEKKQKWCDETKKPTNYNTVERNYKQDTDATGRVVAEKNVSIRNLEMIHVLQEYRYVQCIPALRSRDDDLKKRRKRKYRGPSIKLSSRELSPHSQRKTATI